MSRSRRRLERQSRERGVAHRRRTRRAIAHASAWQRGSTSWGRLAGRRTCTCARSAVCLAVADSDKFGCRHGTLSVMIGRDPELTAGVELRNSLYELHLYEAIAVAVNDAHGQSTQCSTRDTSCAPARARLGDTSSMHTRVWWRHRDEQPTPRDHPKRGTSTPRSHAKYPGCRSHLSCRDRPRGRAPSAAASHGQASRANAPAPAPTECRPAARRRSLMPRCDVSVSAAVRGPPQRRRGRYWSIELLHVTGAKTASARTGLTGSSPHSGRSCW